MTACVTQGDLVDETFDSCQASRNNERGEQNVSLIVVTVQLDESRVSGDAEGRPYCSAGIKAQMFVAVHQQSDQTIPESERLAPSHAKEKLISGFLHLAAFQVRRLESHVHEFLVASQQIESFGIELLNRFS